jgi:hypothetical protein
VYVHIVYNIGVLIGGGQTKTIRQDLGPGTRGRQLKARRNSVISIQNICDRASADEGELMSLLKGHAFIERGYQTVLSYRRLIRTDLHPLLFASKKENR